MFGWSGGPILETPQPRNSNDGDDGEDRAFGTELVAFRGFHRSRDCLVFRRVFVLAMRPFHVVHMMPGRFLIRLWPQIGHRARCYLWWPGGGQVERGVGEGPKRAAFWTSPIGIRASGWCIEGGLMHPPSRSEAATPTGTVEPPVWLKPVA